MVELDTAHDYSPSEFREKFCARCNAHCCRFDVMIPLMKDELGKMTKLSKKLQCDVKLSMEWYEGEFIWVMSHDAKPCGFLDLEANKCRIYDERPLYCQNFFCVPEALFKK